MFSKKEKIKLKNIKFHFLSGFKKEKIKDNYDYDYLLNKIKNEGYDPKKYGYITISKNNYCFDGHHRYQVLEKLYGEDYEIEVLKSKLGYYFEVLLVLSLFLLAVPFRLYNKLKKPLN